MQAHGLGSHLDVAGISYSLALLRLPQLFMATYFVRGVETFSELHISLRRLNAFLALTEPPAPAHLQGSVPENIKAEKSEAEADSDHDKVQMSPSPLPVHTYCVY
jgi:hypothetical protein